MSDSRTPPSWKLICSHCGTTFERTSFKKGQYCSKRCARLHRYHVYYRDTELARGRAWRASNPEKNRACHQSWYERNKEKSKLSHKDWQLRHDFNLTLEEYDDLCEQQRFRCAICRKLCPGRTLKVDHCHTVDRVRKLLCNKCNLGIGMFQEDPNIVLAALEYLVEHNY